MCCLFAVVCDVRYCCVLNCLRFLVARLDVVCCLLVRACRCHDMLPLVDFIVVSCLVVLVVGVCCCCVLLFLVQCCWLLLVVARCCCLCVPVVSVCCWC